MGNDSFKPLNFTDRSNIAYDTAVHTKANNDVVVFICGVTDGSILSEGEENKGGFDGFIMAVNATGNFQRLPLMYVITLLLFFSFVLLLRGLTIFTCYEIFLLW